MAKWKLPKVKGVTRIDEPGGHGVGWYARVTFLRKTYSKYFADASHKGTKNAFAKALAWRNAKEKELGKPRTDRVVTAASSRALTNVTGVYQSKESFVVAWSPAPGTVRREFISIREHGRDEAFRRAVELRRRRERSMYGKAMTEPRTRAPRSKKASGKASKRRR